MKYCVLINPLSNKSHAQTHVVALLEALLLQKPQKITLFFYGYAVNLAFIKHNPWQKLIKQPTEPVIDLLVCSTVAENYLENGKQKLPCFQLAGLGQWLDAVLDADKFMEII